jgi:nucleotide-binding universal stress UspA family protein
MNTRLAERPPVGATAADGDDPHRGRPHIVVLLERPSPASSSLRQVTWFARGLGAELLVTAVVTHGRSLDDLDEFNVETAENCVQEVAAWLVEEGVRATGRVTLALHGEQALAVSDLADGLHADLVIVLARRGSWFGVFPGSVLAHQLMRRRRRPVLVIPDQVYEPGWRQFLLKLVGMDGPQE